MTIMSTIVKFDPTKDLFKQLEIEDVYKATDCYSPDGSVYSRYKPVLIGDKIYVIFKKSTPGEEPVYSVNLREKREMVDKDKIVGLDISAKKLQQLVKNFCGLSLSRSIDDSKNKYVLKKLRQTR